MTVTLQNAQTGTPLAGLGTSVSGSACFVSPNWVNTGVQQANVVLQCAGGVACTFMYDVRFSCGAASNTTAAPTTTVTTTALTTTATATTTGTSAGLVQMVCFQQYTNSSCLEAVGPKECSPQTHCTHIDVVNGTVDKSSLETCYNGYVTISLYYNTSSCRPAQLEYAYNTTLAVCGAQGDQWGITTCGERVCERE